MSLLSLTLLACSASGTPDPEPQAAPAPLTRKVEAAPSSWSPSPWACAHPPEAVPVQNLPAAALDVPGASVGGLTVPAEPLAPLHVVSATGELSAAAASAALASALAGVDGERVQAVTVGLSEAGGLDATLDALVASGHVVRSSPEALQAVAAKLEAACEGVPELPDTVVQFALNVHEWVRPDLSKEWILRVLELHAKHDVPVDVYLTGSVLAALAEDAPEVVTALRDSSQVTISYHARPPMPYYPGFDNGKLRGLQGEALYDAVHRYETQALDMVTGGTVEGTPGGMAYLAEVFGAAPASVAFADGDGDVSRTLAWVSRDLGAKMVATHDHDCELGDRINGLWCRVEQGKVQLFGPPKRDGGEEMAKALGTSASGPWFVWGKVHDNDFFSRGNYWRPIYYRDGDRKHPLKPPYDLGAASSQPKSAAGKQSSWGLYESGVVWAADNRAKVTPMNLDQVLGLLEGSGRPAGI